MRVCVVIIGGGPSGLMLSQLLNRAGISTAVLERRDRDHVLSRIRAGILEQGTVEMMHRAGIADRMNREGHPHSGCNLSTEHGMFRVDFERHGGSHVMLYGQTEVTRDLYDAQDRMGATIIHEADDVTPHDIDGSPYVTYDKAGQTHRIDCDFVAGCDGFHGVSRATIPDDRKHELERVYPFGWLGILSRTPPAAAELIYANHPRGFALASMRNENLSRYYIQVPLEDTVDDWSDDAFWAELKRRLPADVAASMMTGPSVEKSIAPLRSYVCAPMRFGKLFLAGDAAHIVPPTGAKGLNLAMSDIHYLSEGLIAHYLRNDSGPLEAYSDKALARVWQAIRFSWWMTSILHRFPDQDAFDQKMQEMELANLRDLDAAQRAMALSYVGLPF